MLNKKSKWEFDYNLQISVDDYKGIIVSSSLTQNPTDVFELIPQIEQVKSIFGELPPNTQISADNGYSTNENMDHLAENHLDGYISTRKLSRKLKKINKKDKPFGKDKFTFDLEKKHIYLSNGTNTRKPKKLQKQHTNSILDKQLQNMPKTQRMLWKKVYKSNNRLWKSKQDKNAQKNGHRMGSRNLQKKIKNRRMAIWKHKTKSKSNRIQHHWTKKNTNRSKITRNITQFKTNIQRNNTKRTHEKKQQTKYLKNM